MSILRFRLAGLALITVLGASTANAQSGHPPLFAKQGKESAAWNAPARPAPAIEIRQQGRGNAAAAAQNGRRNGATISQNGMNNVGQVNQNGVGNSGTIYQIGRNNEGAITQVGDNNAACLVQLGNGNSAGVTQTGNQSVGIAQNRARTWEFPAELCELHKASDPYFLRRAVRAAF